MPSHPKHDLHLQAASFCFRRSFHDLFLVEDHFGFVELLFQLDLDHVRIFDLSSLDLYLHHVLYLKISKPFQFFGQLFLSAVEHFKRHYFFIQEVDGRPSVQFLRPDPEQLPVNPLQFLLLAKDDKDRREAPTPLLGEILRLDPGFHQGVGIRYDPIFDQDIDDLFEHVLHAHIGLLLLLMNHLYYVVIRVVVCATCFVIGCLVHLHQVVLLEILDGQRGKVVEVVDLRGKGEQGKQED